MRAIRPAADNVPVRSLDDLIKREFAANAEQYLQDDAGNLRWGARPRPVRKADDRAYVCIQRDPVPAWKVGSQGPRTEKSGSERQPDIPDLSRYAEKVAPTGREHKVSGCKPGRSADTGPADSRIMSRVRTARALAYGFGCSVKKSVNGSNGGKADGLRSAKTSANASVAASWERGSRDVFATYYEKIGIDRIRSRR